MKTKCPYCSYIATNHETLNKETNHKERDISFCISCGEVSEYCGKDLIKVKFNSLDKSTQKEIKDIEISWLKTKQLIKFIKQNKEGVKN